MEKIDKVTLFNVLDKFFKEIDKNPISLESIFKSEKDKERYETFFMYAYRKYRAAIYHYNNVMNFLETEKNNVNRKKIELEKTNLDYSSIKMRVSSTANHYVYELSAFVEALKSALDFLCFPISFHLPHITMDSIKTLIKLAKKDRSGEIFDLIRENTHWLEKLRAYRHHLVHRRIITVTNGYEIHVEENLYKKILYPILVPRNPPPYIPDTREKRMIESNLDEIPNLNSSYSITKKKIGNKEKIVDFSLKFTPSSDFIPIDNFMNLYLDLFERFFIKVLKILTKLI